MDRKLVPEIRFKGGFNENGKWVEFIDDWKQCKLSELGKIITGSTPSTQHLEIPRFKAQ